MDANERESGTPEEFDPLREIAMRNAERAASQPRVRSSLLPFLVSVLITAAILGIAYYLWGR